ncbi:leucine-rich repeat-containing protein 20-like [Haliotis asinina]|uniref:leucine-rich repeat-containing protein 20-like n=1 Tax=Haliotis asinina TaxID=109174 RepID=UPI0035319455
MAGRGVTKVVNRCEQAKENRRLDLSECQLTQIPDAVYLLMRNTELETCDISLNLIRRVPAKFGTKFPHLMELHINGNKLTSLPDELRDMHNLKVLDISCNSFESFPSVIFTFNKLRNLNAEDNSITDVDTSRLQSMTSLVEVNLQDNPLTLTSYRSLMEIRLYTVLLTPQDKELDSVD